MAKQTKKPVAKKTTAKKTTVKKPTAKKPKTTAAKLSAITRRPDPNPQPSVEKIDLITSEIMDQIERLEDYAANLRALDRQRHNGVGLKRLGFIEAALRLSGNFPQYFPHWLDTAKFQADLDLFNAIRSLVEVCRSLEEKAWNINIEASDMIYTDALEYYSQVQDAARRRVDSAESIYNELNGFFRSRGQHETPDQPTQKKIKRDVNALIKGTKDGEVIIKNLNPKITRGTHEVIDETFKGNASFKDTEQGSINDA